jgi:hypothetical protein
MARINDIVDRMRSSPNDISFTDAAKVCEHYFGQPRQNGTSHRVYKMPWGGDPRVNIQRGENGKAKAYQVAQIIRAIDKAEQLGAASKVNEDAK